MPLIRETARIEGADKNSFLRGRWATDNIVDYAIRYGAVFTG